MDKVKLGFLGCGSMGQRAHLRNYAQLKDICEVVAVADVKIEQAKKVASVYDIPTVYDKAEELLSNPEIEAVVASQQFSQHVNIAPMVLNAGKHLLTEKPVCIYADNAKEMIEAAKKNNKIHMIANHKRSDPATEYAVDIIRKWKETGEMGRMKYVRITMPPGNWTANPDAPYITDEKVELLQGEAKLDSLDDDTARRYGGFVNYYIHQVNMMRFLLGEDYKLTFADKSGVLLAVESESGVCGTIEMDTYSTSDDWQEKMMICFQKGWVEVCLPAPLMSQTAGKVTVFTDNGSGGMFTSPRLPNLCAMRKQAMNFIAAVKGERTPPCEAVEAVKDLDIAMDYINYMKKYQA